MTLAIGMIGLTNPHSRGHLETLDTYERVTEVAAYDPDPDARAAAADNWPKVDATYDDLDALLARDDIPVVLVHIPNNQAPEVVIKAARAGKHVMCEKPCARNADEFRPVIEELERRQLQFTTFYNWRRHPAVRKMRELIVAGVLGRLTSIELRIVTTQVRLRDPSHWIFKRDVTGGGILSWLACHYIDMMRYLTGQEVASVAALAGTLSGEDINVEDVASVSFRLTGGALASLHAGYLLSTGKAGYEGARNDTAIIFRGIHGTLSLVERRGQPVVKLQTIAPEWKTAPDQTFRFALPAVASYGGAHGLAFVDDFIQKSLDGVGQISVSADDALKLLEIIDAIYLSVEQEQVVHMPGGTPSP